MMNPMMMGMGMMPNPMMMMGGMGGMGMMGMNPGVMPGMPGQGFFNALPGRFGRDMLGRGTCSCPDINRPLSITDI